MDGQFIAVVAIAIGAAIYVLRAFWKSLTKAGQGGCASGCGKCSAPIDAPRRSGMIALDQIRK